MDSRFIYIFEYLQVVFEMIKRAGIYFYTNTPKTFYKQDHLRERSLLTFI